MFIWCQLQFTERNLNSLKKILDVSKLKSISFDDKMTCAQCTRAHAHAHSHSLITHSIQFDTENKIQ